MGTYVYKGQSIEVNRHPLGQGQRHFFEGADSLFDQVGRALCDLNYLAKKELFESYAFAARAKRFISRFPKGEPVKIIDVGSGHGLTSFFFASFNPSRVSSCQVIDPLTPERLDCLWGSLKQIAPRVCQKVERSSLPFAEWYEQFEASSESEKAHCWIGCHACGELSDAILAVACYRKEPFFLMPCCPNRKVKGAWPEGFESLVLPDIPSEQNLGFALDLLRLGRVQSKGYKVTLRKIDPAITPFNRVLIGRVPSSV